MHSRDGIVRQQVTVELSERVSYLVHCDPSQLSAPNELGQPDFQSGREIFRGAVELGKDVQSFSLELIPQGTREQLFEVLDGLVQSLKRIESFSPNGGSPTQQRDALLYDLEGQYERAFNFVTPYLTYLHLKSAHVMETNRRSADQLQQSVRQVNASLEELRLKLARIDQDLENRRKIEAEPPPRPSPGIYPTPVVHSYSVNQASHTWFWFLILAGVLIAGLIWVGSVIYHWGDYGPSSTRPAVSSY